ncbi:putative RNA methyltransferase [Marinomonas posidonica]|uniref:rRNA (Guanine-N(1)-)-methyltransferase n=1 Tax=Marinomonas posidonica (strain CECT 7376 / NCIMB 14433 / IVIA-Po-181) TaxID=491952 RepID=F6CT46_MARPP|nr:methyltransferase domain-containing protein [Marinomonas posidonica]AEF55104.1 rRNA (guanine-N(1)-)-methyltransferase [Marinomonas posidonica IVIA-Po-181]
MPSLENLSCPIDDADLQLEGRSLRCPNGHCFDLAKTGYVNLLPVQNKRSKDPGDSKEMVLSRQTFLNQQHYYPIVEAILASWPNPQTSSAVRILDAGCGEGYYLSHLGEALEKHNIEVDRVGLDISKWAIMSASKRDKNISWIVGSNASLPVPDERFDVILCLFGFPVFEEFSRALDDSGSLLLVESGPRHLIELREVLYDRIHDYKPTYPDGIASFELQSETSKCFSFELHGQAQIQDLLSMTPHIHKASYEGKLAIQKIETMTITADIKLRWYRKKTGEK